MNHLNKSSMNSRENFIIKNSMPYVPKRPPKPSNLSEPEPVYMTTLPGSLQPTVIPLPPKPTLKSILKNGTNGKLIPERVRSSSTPNFTSNSYRKDLEDIGHFDIDVEEKGSVEIDEENQSSNSEDSPLNDRKRRKKRKNEESKHSQKPETPKIKPPFQMTDEMREKATFGARVESIAGIAHLIVIIMSIITLIVLAKLASIWELQLRRCPLYVEVSQNTGVYWGNEKMVACHYAAYMPALILIMSLSLIVFHGGILYSFRSESRASRLLLSRTYPKVIFFVELLELAIAISVASVILDGVRQTCLSFQLSPWTEERPRNCKEGYDDRDHVYGITKTYSRLITSIVTSIISVCMLILTTVLYLIRINPCCRGRMR